MFQMFPVVASSGKIVRRDKRHSRYNLKATAFVIPRSIVLPTLDPFWLQQNSALWGSGLSGYSSRLRLRPARCLRGRVHVHNAAPSNHQMFMRGCR